MKEQMSSKERIEAALAGKATDRTPFSPNMAYVWDSFPEETRRRGLGAFLKDAGADPMWRGAPCPVKEIRHPDAKESIEEKGSQRRVVYSTPAGSISMLSERSAEGGTWFLTEHPLKKEEDYKVWAWMEERASFAIDMAPVRKHLEGDGAEGLSVGMLIPRGKSAFQRMVETLVGTEELCYALADYPETVESLLEIMVRKDIEAATLAVQSNAYEWFITWEDSSTQNYSPELYGRHIAPEIGSWSQLLAGAGMKYMHHACGHVKGLLDMMKDSGMAAIESVSPPPTGNIPLKDVRQRLGPGIGIVGGIEPTLFLSKSMEELPAYVEQVIEDAQGGPFVLANSDSCPPGVCPGKFKLVAETARRWRR